MNKLVCIVGMTGSGKSVVSDYLVNKGYSYLRFGQITMDLIKKRGLEPTEVNEKIIRESVRKEHGMGAYALLNIPKFDELLKKGNVVGDGLYSWSEYKILREKYGNQLVVLAVFAPPELRYSRLVNRTLLSTDVSLKNRPATLESAMSRDFAEIENIEKGGPIAMSDFTLINTGSVSELILQLEKVLFLIKGE
ncbi:MAG: AAA family ATPase [Candidatus ainarchaeum sp.]|nr:AAA family ATPase [Candidatus ainarchaeum sp.]MDD3085856.1 AAA family ATPase [Candidatus ainarchaeum sp.]MDD4128561.1 AAA family ATPase [Candidatus ainarchaeum sp.]MDD4468261.1 AAA family ATPase [Candidatus ainarchaeum sp.]